MGLRLFGSGCDCGCDSTIAEHQKNIRRLERQLKELKRSKDIRKVVNPDPRNFEVLKTLVNGRYTVVMVKYPNCTNYEGNKILVFEDMTPEQLEKLSFLDPHFCKSKRHPSPIARFEPTERGWDMARTLINYI